MSGLDQFASSETGASGAERLEPLAPDDFTPDEALFAGELRDLYDIEREDLPVGYVPTVLGYERHKPAPPGFERRLTQRVFRELELRRPLFEGSPFRQIGAALVEPLTQLRGAGRSAVAVLASVMLVMVLSMIFATPSFADGLQILLGHTGVQQVAAYPHNVRNPEQQLPAEREDIQTPLYWMGENVGDYSYLGMRTLPSGGWSNGPIVDIQYVLTHTSNGSGVLDVRMFQVSHRYAAVLKVVQSGSAHETTVDADRAIFVDGAWQGVSRQQVWRTGTRTELILERNGVVFWIAADPRDGIGESQLVALASKLQPATRAGLVASRVSVGSVGHELRALMQSPAGHDVYALLPRGAAPGSMSELVVYQPPISPHQVDMN